MYGIDLTKIESRPKRNDLSGVKVGFDYLFYLEYLSDPDTTQKILDPLGQTIEYYKLLGSYPVNNTIYRPHSNLHVAIVGFGRFGQFLSEKMSIYHRVSAYSRSDYSNYCQHHQLEWKPSLTELIASRPDVVIISVSIKSFETVLQKLTDEINIYSDYRPLVIDVLSVKEYPVQLMSKYIPSRCDILATHPMFGPDSCPTSDWSDQPLVYSKIRIKDINRFNAFMYSLQECKLIMMEGSFHDQCAASSQFIAHLVGNIMGELELQECPIDTATYKSLLRIRDLIKRDSKDLFHGLYCYNQFSQASLDKFQSSVSCIADELKKNVTKQPLTLEYLDDAGNLIT